MKRNHIILGVLFVSTVLTLIFTRRNADDPIVEAAPRTRAPGISPRTSSASAVVAIAALQARTPGEAADGGHKKLFGTTLLAPPLPSSAIPPPVVQLRNTRVMLLNSAVTALSWVKIAAPDPPVRSASVSGLDETRGVAAKAGAARLAAAARAAAR